jgi:2-methylisocitrate lyase-like PEP mutase family enzyme
MASRVRDIIHIDEADTLDRLIETLSRIRDDLPAGARAEVELPAAGLTVAVERAQTAEEAAAEARYAEAYREARERLLSGFPLRIVA